MCGNVFAKTDDPPPITPNPWSSYYWSENPNTPPNLFEDGGPMEKYELFKGSTGAKDFQKHYKCNCASPCWHGHCHAWAAASILESDKEPRYGIDIGKINQGQVVFYVKDLKGLLIMQYHNSMGESDLDTRNINNGELTPRIFWEILRQKIRDEKVAVVIDTTIGTPQWNFPIYKYHIDYNQQPNASYYCTGYIECASDFVGANYIGTLPIKIDFEFMIDLDENDNPITNGNWENGVIPFDFLWHSSVQRNGNPYVDYDKVRQLIDATSYVKKIIVSQGSNTYEAHWNWKADQQQKELVIDENDIFNSPSLNFEIAFGKSMDTSFSGFKVELQNPNTSSWVTLPSGSWGTTGTFPDDKWTGSYTIPANEANLWHDDVKIKITAKGMDGQALDSNPISLAPDAGSDILHPRIRNSIPARVAVDKLTFARKCQPKLTFSYLFGKEQPLV